jgi:aminoglycoside 3-N-acetyltransferase I
MAVEILKLKRSDLSLFKETIELFTHVFELENPNLPPDDHLKMLLKKEDFFVFAALLEGKVVGGLSVYTLHQYHSVKPLAYIYDLAVQNQLQRQGIGKKLITAVNAYCTKQGYEEVYVQADKDEEHAVNFYHSTKPAGAEEVAYFYYTL